MLQVACGFLRENDMAALRSTCARLKEAKAAWTCVLTERRSHLPTTMSMCVVQAVRTVDFSKLPSKYTLKDAHFAAVAQFTNLESLDFKACYFLTDACLVTVGQLKFLKHLRISRGISGSFFEHLAKLENLESLNCWGTVLANSNIGLLARLPRLTDLNIGSCEQLTSDALAFVAKLPHLTTLNVSDCAWISGGFKHLSRMLTLEHLFATGCLINDDLEHLQRLPLKTLDVSCNDIEPSGLAAISNITTLTRLEIRECFSAADGFDSLLNLKHLTRLAVDQICDRTMSAQLESMHNLTSLELNGSECVDLSKLAGLKLRSLMMFNCMVKDKDLVHIPNTVKELNLGQNMITDAGLESLACLPHLIHLYLADSKITDYGVEQICIAKGLKILTLSETRITDQGVAHLATLPCLETLNVAGTAITDSGCAHLAQVKTLKILNLDGCKITDAGIDLLPLYNLRRISLDATKVSFEKCERLLASGVCDGF